MKPEKIQKMFEEYSKDKETCTPQEMFKFVFDILITQAQEIEDLKAQLNYKKVH